MLGADVRSTQYELWPIQVSLFETPIEWDVNGQLAWAAIEAVGSIDASTMQKAAKRRVCGILEQSAAGQALKAHLFVKWSGKFGQRTKVYPTQGANFTPRFPYQKVSLKALQRMAALQIWYALNLPGCRDASHSPTASRPRGSKE
ncbi:hypothetical protein B9057_04140 [Aestuarium zhoushanense]|nr:hypothetical protein B9057_04140 [Aestuarium zhoushanense]